MKREFKQGDRVLVRNHDLEEWQEAIFESLAERKEQSHPFIQFCPFIVKLLEGGEFWYKQCRHIDDFRTGDKVQVRISKDYEWEDKIYGCFDDGATSYGHCVYENVRGKNMWGWYDECRWHPSMPWAEKEEPLTLEQRVEALERKMNEQ